MVALKMDPSDEAREFVDQCTKEQEEHDTTDLLANALKARE
jgi:hypothetical protein